MERPSLTETVTRAWEALPTRTKQIAVNMYVTAPLLAPTLAYAENAPKIYPGPEDFIMITAGATVTAFVIVTGEAFMRPHKIPGWGRALAHVPTLIFAGAYVASILGKYG